MATLAFCRCWIIATWISKSVTPKDRFWNLVIENNIWNTSNVLWCIWRKSIWSWLKKETQPIPSSGYWLNTQLLDKGNILSYLEGNPWLNVTMYIYMMICSKINCSYWIFCPEKYVLRDIRNQQKLRSIRASLNLMKENHHNSKFTGCLKV